MDLRDNRRRPEIETGRRESGDGDGMKRTKERSGLCIGRKNVMCMHIRRLTGLVNDYL